MTFEVGAALEDAKWQAPAYCFDKDEEEDLEYQSGLSQMLARSLKGLSQYDM